MAEDADLQRGRERFARRSWSEASTLLAAADRAVALGPEDLERQAVAAYMLGDEAAYVAALERAHRAHAEAGRPRRAVRCAFWIGVTLARRGADGQAGGWLARAHRLLERDGGGGVERGYLLLPAVFARAAGGDLEAAAAIAAEAAAIGEQLGDADLFALAAHEQGHLLIRAGRGREGVRLLDEAMVAVIAGELSPVVSGIVYCGAILACQDACDVQRAQEWTTALSAWCEHQPDLVAFTGRCLVHRAELLQLHGAWPQALEEARRAGARCLLSSNAEAAGEAAYREGEIHRLRGEDAAAEERYRAASRHGREPHPGLALLRLGQGDTAAAAKAIRRVAREAAGPGHRAAVLTAYVEILLAQDDVAAAAGACDELEAIVERQAGDVLGATAAQARAAIDLAAGDADAALAGLRRAQRIWERLDAPHEAARTRELAGAACRALGDEEAAALELEAARAGYAALGAAPDLARVVGGSGAGPHADGGLSARELQVLRGLVAGRTNRAIADELVLSHRTVDRHVSNIYIKLGVSSRAAATAYAYEHRLL